MKINNHTVTVMYIVKYTELTYAVKYTKLRLLITLLVMFVLFD